MNLGSEQAAIQEALANFIDAFNRLDWERFLNCFAPEATVFHPMIPEQHDLHRIDGRDAVARSFRTVFRAAHKQNADPPYLNIQPKDVEIQPLTDGAIVTFHFDRRSSSFGRRTLVFEKRQDKWLIVHLHASNIEP